MFVLISGSAYSVQFFFSLLIVTAKVHKKHVYCHSMFSIAKLAKVIDFKWKRKLTHSSTSKTRSLKVLQFMENNSGIDSIILITLESSFIKGNWSFTNFFRCFFTLNSLLLPSTSSNFNVKPFSVLKLFLDHPNTFWEHVNNIPLPPLEIFLRRYLEFRYPHTPFSQRFAIDDSWSVLDRAPRPLPKNKISLRLIHFPYSVPIDHGLDDSDQTQS